MEDQNSASAVAGADENARPANLPAGEYAIVEVVGRRTLVGRVTEVDRFGTKLLSVEPIYACALLPAVLIGGSSLYQFTPCAADVALKRAPKYRWQMPASLVATLPDEADDVPALPFLDRDDDDHYDEGGPY